MTLCLCVSVAREREGSGLCLAPCRTPSDKLFAFDVTEDADERSKTKKKQRRRVGDRKIQLLRGCTPC